jgi:hypothetical protein
MLELMQPYIVWWRNKIALNHGGLNMPFQLSAAKAFVESVDLAGTRRNIVSMSAATEASAVFDQAKTQAQVVGSGVFSFAQGVDAMVRESISDSALLAQLVANKHVEFEKQPREWFKAYADVLENVGWTLQEGSWTTYPASGTGVEVNEKLIEVMTAVLAPAAGALSIIKSTMDALKAMDPGSSWITIFTRESQRAKIARFQVGLVDKDPAGDVFVSLVACVVEASNTITQVLFFKFKASEATFSAYTSKVSINRAALTDLGPTIRTKIRAYQTDYLSSIKDI